MRAVCTCDEVFDVLTREPFPSGGMDDELVEAHLAVCHDCRRLAEAFRPAVALFHESLTAADDDRLPMYLGRLKPMMEAPAASPLAAQRPKLGSPGRDRPLPAPRMPVVAASLALVGLVVFAVLAAMPRGDDSVPTAATVRALDDQDHQLLVTLKIPDDCRDMPNGLDASRIGHFVCCTTCHHAADGVGSTPRAIRTSTAACVACHDHRLRDALSMVLPSHKLGETLVACATIQSL